MSRFRLSEIGVVAANSGSGSVARLCACDAANLPAPAGGHARRARPLHRPGGAVRRNQPVFISQIGLIEEVSSGQGRPTARSRTMGRKTVPGVVWTICQKPCSYASARNSWSKCMRRRLRSPPRQREVEQRRSRHGAAAARCRPDGSGWGVQPTLHALHPGCAMRLVAEDGFASGRPRSGARRPVGNVLPRSDMRILNSICR